jgi:hypothetical protein
MYILHYTVWDLSMLVCPSVFLSDAIPVSVSASDLFAYAV